MAEDKKEQTVDVELLADGIRVEGVDYVQGDVVTLPKSHAERLQKHGSVGPKGTIEKRRKAEQDRAEADAAYQRHLQGLGSLEEAESRDDSSSAAKPGPRSASK